MTADLHADQIQGFFDFPVDHIYTQARYSALPSRPADREPSIASPDMGVAKRANAYCVSGCPMIICHKSREKANVVGSMTAIGEVKTAFRSSSTTWSTPPGPSPRADMLSDLGALGARGCHPRSPFRQRLREDRKERHEGIHSQRHHSVESGSEIDKSKFTVLTLSGIFADVIDKVYNYKPISPTFIF